MAVIARERILKAAMEAACDEAERLGYGGELGYAEAASIGEKAATVALDQLAGAVERIAELEAILAPDSPEAIAAADAARVDDTEWPDDDGGQS